jgi:hypothetical protein
MRLSALLLTLVAIAFSATAQDFIGENCQLDEPPQGSGELFLSVGKVSVVGRVYPRLSQISNRYSGCQVAWISINGGSVTRSVTKFVEGRVVAIEPVPDGIPLCAPGEKVADTGCTSRKTAVVVSYPPGCAARTMGAKLVPQDCLAAFQAEFKLHDQVAD